MLGGRMTNADEEEVEDELAALEAEVNKVSLPAVPDTQLPEPVAVPEAQAAQTKQTAERQMLAA